MFHASQLERADAAVLSQTSDTAQPNQTAGESAMPDNISDHVGKNSQLSDHDSIMHEDEHEAGVADDGKEQEQTDAVVLSELERLVINLNHTAMEFLRGDSFTMAVALLRKAEDNLLQVDDSIS
jgi:hypothetical protein